MKTQLLADWELISINAIPKGLEKLPMGPVTMMRNQLNLIGGTKASYTKDEWAESVRFAKICCFKPEKRKCIKMFTIW